MDNFLRPQRHHLIALVLILATLAVYWRVLNHEFVNYDDGGYITQNKHVQAGLTLESISWAFTTSQEGNWHPLTWISHMLDCQLYGLNPTGHHLTNLFFHIANTLLLFLVFRRMTGLPAGGSLTLHSFSDGARFGPQAGAVWQSAFIAALFALHPLHVESVAWASERKDVLSTFFWMLTMWAYVGYVERPGARRYLLVALALVLGLMAKPMLVTLPFVLLLLDYWPLGRPLNASSVSARSHSEHSRSVRGEKINPRLIGMNWKSVLPLIREKIPLFVLVAISSVVTYMAQQREGAVSTFEGVPVKFRIANALVSYVRYLEKMVWPSNLAVIYPHPVDTLQMWQAGVAGVLLVLLSTIAVLALRKRPYIPVGWYWYMGTLVPVIGFIQVGAQSMADRYTYVPLIGVFMIIGWGIPDLFARFRSRRIGLAVAGGTIVLALSLCTWSQLGYWRDPITLMVHATNVTSNNWVAHSNLAITLSGQGKYSEAIDHYLKSLRFFPGNAETHHLLGVALDKQGKIEEAISHYAEALRLKPDYAEAHNNLGAALARQGKITDAIAHYSEALRIKPDYAEAHNNFGSLLAEQGKIEEAIQHFTEALRISPEYEDARNNLKLAESGNGRIAESVALYSEVLRVNPRDAEAHTKLGSLLADQEKTADALEHFSEALKIKPDFVEAHKNLAGLLTKHGKIAEAIVHYTRAVQLSPDDAVLRNELGSLLGRDGRITEAIRHLFEAVRLKPDYADAHNNLGIALAMQGKTAEAIEHFSEVIRINPGHASAHYNLGLVLGRQGKIADAIAHYSEAVRINPDYAEARSELERLRQLQSQAQSKSLRQTR